MEIKLIIEHTRDDYFSITTIDPEALPFFAFGEGRNVKEARTDYMNVLTEMAKMNHYDISGLTFTYCYDLSAFLAVYKWKMSLAGLQNITGVGQGQLSHYLNGQRKPSKATARKVNEAIHAFAEELSKVEIVQLQQKKCAQLKIFTQKFCQ
jgi:hypothetical protein